MRHLNRARPGYRLGSLDVSEAPELTSLRGSGSLRYGPLRPVMVRESCDVLSFLDCKDFRAQLLRSQRSTEGGVGDGPKRKPYKTVLASESNHEDWRFSFLCA